MDDELWCPSIDVTDEPILDVIAAYLEPHGRGDDPRWLEDPTHFLAALRDAGYDIAPIDTIRLGRTAERLPTDFSIRSLYAEAGVTRP